MKPIKPRLPENPDERRMFDSGRAAFPEASMLSFIAYSLEIEYRCAEHHGERGSYMLTKAITANELRRVDRSYSALREIAQAFLSEYEELEEDDWSPAWRSLAKRCRAALANARPTP